MGNGINFIVIQWSMTLSFIQSQQTCSVGTDHGYGYGYGYEAMGMGTDTGSRPWVWVRVRVRDHGYGYGYGYDMWQSHGYAYGYGYGYETIDMGMGTGTVPWVWVPWVRVWVQVQDVKSRMKDCGYNYSYAALYLGTCTWVPNRIWDFVSRHIVTRPCETIPPLSMLYMGKLLLY